MFELGSRSADVVATLIRVIKVVQKLNHLILGLNNLTVRAQEVKLKVIITSPYFNPHYVVNNVLEYIHIYSFTNNKA